MANFNLGFTMQYQEQSKWCWAATAASVDHYFNPNSSVTQCGLANYAHGQTTCCVDGSTPQCNKGSDTGNVLRMLSRLRSQVAQPQPFGTVDQEIMANRPVGCRIAWSGGGNHAVVISGVGDAGNQLLTLHDSWYGTSYILIGTFTTAYQGAGSWVRTWFLQ